MKSSRPAILELAAKYKSLITELQNGAKGTQTVHDQEKAEEVLFKEMCEICLWGNATDLSLLTSLTYEDIQKLQGADARKAAEQNILVNDLSATYQTLIKERQSGKSDRQVDIVLDNAGFELFVDLVLAGYLLEAKLATRIVLHCKRMPWFVSDVIPADFQSLLAMLAQPNELFATDRGDSPAGPALSADESNNLAFLFEHWSTLHSEGELILRPHPFWTTGTSYWDLIAQEPGLHEDFKASELVIFKGDLNYRKLTADARWDTTTPFASAIGPLGKLSGVRVLALRTCKADTVVGLSEGRDLALRAANGEKDDKARRWAWSGKYAVVQFCDGKL